MRGAALVGGAVAAVAVIVMMAARPASSVSASPPASAARAPTPPVAASGAALEPSRSHAGTELLARSKASGRWTAAERDEARHLLPRLPGPDRAALLKGLAAAMNRGEIVLDGLVQPL